MPRTKKINSSQSSLNSGQQEQRRLFWLILLLTVLASVFLFFIFWQSVYLKALSPLSKQSFLPLASNGGVLAEQSLTPIASREDGLQRLSFKASPDGRSFAYVIKKNNEVQVVLNDVAEPLFDEIRFMTFSSDGQNFAYIARRADKIWAVVNGESHPAYDFILSPYFFSPDSRYFIYKARQGPKEVLVINGHESRPYELIYDPLVTVDNGAIVFFALDDNQLWRGEIPLADFD